MLISLTHSVLSGTQRSLHNKCTDTVIVRAGNFGYHSVLSGTQRSLHNKCTENEIVRAGNFGYHPVLLWLYSWRHEFTIEMLYDTI